MTQHHQFVLVSLLCGPDAILFILPHRSKLLQPSHQHHHQHLQCQLWTPLLTGTKVYHPNWASVWKKLPGRSTWCPFHAISETLVSGSPAESQQGHQVHSYPTTTQRTSNTVLWLKPDLPNHFEVKFSPTPQLCWDDTPEMDINSVRFSRDWFRTSTVLRNAYVLWKLRRFRVGKECVRKISGALAARDLERAGRAASREEMGDVGEGFGETGVTSGLPWL